MLLLLLRHLFAKGPHRFAQSLHRLTLIIDGLGKVTITQRVLGIVHRPARTVERIARIFSAGRPLSGQVLLLPPQLFAQRLLPVGQ